LKKTTSIAIGEDTLREIDNLDLSKSVSRSGIFRIAMSEFLEKEKSEKREAKNEKGEK
jgi:metal-responsive CopG/Arc/MetJ family transcriptional regulator